MARLDKRYGGGPMSVVRYAMEIDARPEEVWSVVADPRHLVRWNAHIRSVTGVPPGGLVEGSAYTTELRILGHAFKIRARVLEIDPPRSSVIRLSGPLDAVIRTWVRPVGKSHARLEHEVEYHFKGGRVGELIAKAVQHVGAPSILKHGVRAQKEQVESG